MTFQLVQPAEQYQPVDYNKAAMSSYTLADTKGQYEDAQKERESYAIIKQYMANGGNLSTPDGVSKAITDLQGKIEPKIYGKLVDVHNNMDKHVLDIREKLAQLGPEEAKALDAAQELQDRHLKHAVDAYMEAVKDHPENKAAAMADYQSAIKAQVQFLTQPGPNGQPPIITPQKGEAIVNMPPEVVKSNMEAGKWFQDQRKEVAQIHKLEAEATKAEEQAKTAKMGGGAAVEIQRLLDDVINDPDSSQTDIYEAKRRIDFLSTRGGSLAYGNDEPLTDDGQKARDEMLATKGFIPRTTRNSDLNRMGSKEKGGAGSGSIASARADFAADQASYAFQQKRVDAIHQNAEKIKADMRTLDGVMKTFEADKLNGPKALNQPLNFLRKTFTKNEELGKLDLALKQVGTEYERLIQGGQLSIQQLHQGAAEDAKSLLNSNMSLSEVKAKLPVMLQEMKNQEDTARENLSDIKKRRQESATSWKSGDETKATKTKVDQNVINKIKSSHQDAASMLNALNEYFDSIGRTDLMSKKK